MVKIYKTSSGTFSESDLVIAIWINPKREKARPNARRLETLTSEKSIFPIAFPLEKLQTIASWMYCTVARESSEVDEAISSGKATRQNPLLVPLSLARSYLGWDEFYIPTEYTDVK
jgi:hypothetical protein